MTIKIDGAQGEGGGQVLRTALTLAMCTGQDLEVTKIRAGRARPGLLRQHLSALRAAKTISDAEVMGDELRSESIRFVPGKIKAGDYEFKIGTAGSTTLLAQTIVPALAQTNGTSILHIEGGTHNGMAPSVDFIEQCFCPQAAKLGMVIESNLITHGFYPNGGGQWQCTVKQAEQTSSFSLIERGALLSQEAMVTSANIEPGIAERELARVKKKLGFAESRLQARQVRSPGPGNIVSIRLHYDNVTEVFESVGALGVPAKRVAGRAIAAAKRYSDGTHAVGEYLADQLLVPMILGPGGEFMTKNLSEHTKTNIAVIEQMLGQTCIDTRETSVGTLVRVHNVRL